MSEGERPQRQLEWAYGVTTVLSRRGELLPRTLTSLRNSGFDRPRLFVDGSEQATDWKLWARETGFGDLEITTRDPVIRTFGNWVLALGELYIRHPEADRYALFQDDLVTCRNLRVYLDLCCFPALGYWNLYTFLSNQRVAPRGLDGKTPRQGWYRSYELGGHHPPGYQAGKGAVALVFDRKALVTLLTSLHMIERPQDAERGWKVVDGGIVSAMNKAGYSEYVHYPSLVQHTGRKSSMGNRSHPSAPSFPGENCDLLELIVPEVLEEETAVEVRG